MIQPVQPPPGVGHSHAVRFYKESDSLCRMVAEFLAHGIAKGAAAIAIAVPAHRQLICKHLGRLGFDVGGLQDRDDLILLDARHTLASFCDQGEIDETRFSSSVHALITRARRGRDDCAICVYGEAVDLLWKEGMTAAAMRLEMLWNQLASTYPLRVLCGYSMGNSYKDASIEEITCTHTHVLGADGRSREIARV